MMTNFKNITVLIAVMAMIFLVSCGKEDETTPEETKIPLPKDTGYRVLKIVETKTWHSDNSTPTTTTETLEYDDEKRLIKYTDNGEVHTIKYENGKVETLKYKNGEIVDDKQVVLLGDRNEVKSVSENNIQIRRFEYNDDYTLSQSITGNNIVEYTYDNQGRKKLEIYKVCPDGSTNECSIKEKISYTYGSQTGIVGSETIINDYLIYNVVFLGPLVIEQTEEEYEVDDNGNKTTKTTIITHTYEMDDKKRVTKWTEVEKNKNKDGSETLEKTTVRVYTW